MTNDTYSGKRHINVGIEHIWTHLIGFHGNIFRDGALPNLEKHLFQVIWCVSTLIR